MLRGTLAGSTPRLSADVRPEEALTSYVFHERQIVRRTNTIHHSRLMPRRKYKNERLEVSVCRSSRLTEAHIWELCSLHFDVHAPNPAIGRGVGSASAVFDVNLSFDPDGKPYPQHANIVGWHDATDKPDSELKHFWMVQAQKVASQFKYLPRR
jgi:hypothetical protein